MLGSIAGAAISAAGGLAGSLLGKRKSGLDLRKLRREAVRNGFNPLTVLRATGGAGFQRTGTTNPILSSIPFLADALGQGIQTAFNQPSAADEEAEALKQELMREELRRLRGENTYMENAPDNWAPFGFSIPLYDGPSVGATGTAAARVAPALSGGSAAARAAVPPTAQGFPEQPGSTAVLTSDGSLAANPENPREPEQDAWAWATNFQFIPEANRLIAGNLGLPATPGEWIDGHAKAVRRAVREGVRYFGFGVPAMSESRNPMRREAEPGHLDWLLK